MRRPPPSAHGAGRDSSRSPRGSRYARYGVVLALGGLASLRFASFGGVVGGLLIWIAACSFVVASGYTSFGARVLGKRSNGDLPVVHRAVLLPFFVVTWASWHLSALARERPYDRVGSGLYLGRLPRPGDLPSDVAVLVDLTAEFEVDRRLRRELEYLCLPTLDGTAPDESGCLAIVERLRVHPGPVYVHCAYGHGRSALVAAALLLARGEARTIAEAVTQLQAARPRVALTAPQRASLERMFGALAPHPSTRDGSPANSASDTDDRSLV